MPAPSGFANVARTTIRGVLRPGRPLRRAGSVMNVFMRAWVSETASGSSVLVTLPPTDVKR